MASKQAQMQRWNSLVSEQLVALREPGTERPKLERGPESGEDMRRHALCTPKGALLLLSRARDFLKTVVYQEELRLGDGPDERVRLSQTADGRKFGRGDKSFAGEQYISFGSGHLSGFTCTIYLPEVRLCSAHPDGELLPYRIELPGKTFDSKSDAEDFTALAACRHLHAIGVLDDQLFVVGRAEARAELYARLGRPHKLGSRK